MCSGTIYILQDFFKAKISNAILAVFQLMNEMSAIATNNFIANLDYLFYTSVIKTVKLKTAIGEGRLFYTTLSA
jgi:hypothetical protein